MKKIITKSYVQAQQQTVTFDPKSLKSPQNNPRINAFQQAFNTLALAGITELSQTDATSLDSIQAEIRQKLRMVKYQPRF